MILFSLSKIFPDGLRIFAFAGDFLICAFSFFLAKYLFDFLSPLIGKPPVAFEAWQYLKGHGLGLWLVYAFLNYVLSSLKLILNRSWKLGWPSLCLSTGIYLIWLSYWIEKQGFALKTFFLFSFFVLLSIGIVWRLLILKKLLEVDWESWLHPSLLKAFQRSRAYFKEKPSGLFFVFFMILLTCCVSLLALNQISIAEKLADGAYLSLTMGVLVEFVQVIRDRNKDKT